MSPIIQPVDEPVRFAGIPVVMSIPLLADANIPIGKNVGPVTT